MWIDKWKSVTQMILSCWLLTTLLVQRCLLIQLPANKATCVNFHWATWEGFKESIHFQQLCVNHSGIWTSSWIWRTPLFPLLVDVQRSANSGFMWPQRLHGVMHPRRRIFCRVLVLGLVVRVVKIVKCRKREQSTAKLQMFLSSTCEIASSGMPRSCFWWHVLAKCWPTNQANSSVLLDIAGYRTLLQLSRSV